MGHWKSPREKVFKIQQIEESKLGAIQKLRNGQKEEGVNDFVTYRYVYFEGKGDILRNNYVTVDTKFENLKNVF